MIFGLRHGERADYGLLDEQNLVEIDFDPHLTKLGVQQAECTGKFIQEKIEEYESSLKEKNINSGKPLKVIIVASPFLRTIQTAFGIATNIKNLHENSIFLQDHFCEHLSGQYFKEQPLDNIFYRSRTLEDLNSYVDLKGTGIQLKDNLFEDPSLEIPQWVEKNIDERVEKTLKALFNHYLNNFPFNEYVLIYVSHAKFITSSLDFLGGFSDFVDYCGVIQLQFTDAEKKNAEKFKLLIRGDSGHLKYDGLL